MLAQLITTGILDAQATEPDNGPTPAQLRMRYPAFAGVDDATIAYWITDAISDVPATWGVDTPRAIFALAAHRMSRAGVAGLALAQISGVKALGVSSFRSGQFEVDFDPRQIAAAKVGEFSSTVYGQDYVEIAGRHVSTFGCTGPGILPCDGWSEPYRVGWLPC